MTQWSKRSREALVVRWNGHKDNLTQYRLETIGVEEVVEFAPDAIPETVHVGQVPSPNRTMKAGTNFFEPAKGFPTWLTTGPTDLSRFKALFDDVGVKYTDQTVGTRTRLSIRPKVGEWGDEAYEFEFQNESLIGYGSRIA